ncbi:MAG: hypothetical protein H0U92_00925 [Actinobacteria bacterium]|nr:hypothetical protein [Actinomycetota bacterium]
MADAELSSLSSTLDDLRRRIEVRAEAHQAAGDEEMAVDLYEVERSLATALRRLSRLVSSR